MGFWLVGRFDNIQSNEYLFLEIVKVYDGYNSLRKRLFRTVTVPKTATKDDLLHASMKAFVVTQVDADFDDVKSTKCGPLGISKFLSS